MRKLEGMALETVSLIMMMATAMARHSADIQRNPQRGRHCHSSAECSSGKGCGLDISTKQSQPYIKLKAIYLISG